MLEIIKMHSVCRKRNNQKRGLKYTNAEDSSVEIIARMNLN